MAMFDDPKKELEQLQKQLLEEEEWFARELDSAKQMIGDAPAYKPAKPAPKKASAPKAPEGAAPVRNYANGYGADEKKDKGKKKKKKGIRGLVILAALETLGIVGIVAYWILFLLK